MEQITRTFTDTINGVNLTIIDEINSITSAWVFRELRENFYGIDNLDIKSEHTILDVGANIGIFSIYAKKLYGCKIVAFEPVLENFENFKKNIILNGFTLEDFEIHNVAITNRDGDKIQIGTPVNNTGGSSVYSAIIHDMKNITHTSECVTESLRKYINDSCVYLKLDCEGGEYDIIPDIVDQLKTFKWIGAELHTYIAEHDANRLLRTIKENFNGKLYFAVMKCS